MAFLQCRLQEILHDPGVPGHDSWRERLSWNEASEDLPSFGIREVYQGLSFGLEDIEEIKAQRDSLNHVLDAVYSAEPAHQVLKGYRFSTLPQSDNLPLNQEFRRLHPRLGIVDDLRNTICDIG